MKVTFAHLCDYAMVAQDGKLSILGIFGTITAQTVPVTHPSLYLAFEIEFDYAEAGSENEMRIELVDEDGRKIAEVNGKMRFDGPSKIGQNPRLGQIVNFQQLVLPRFGMYNANIFCNSIVAVHVSMEVRPIGGPSSGPAAHQ